MTNNTISFVNIYTGCPLFTQKFTMNLQEKSVRANNSDSSSLKSAVIKWFATVFESLLLCNSEINVQRCSFLLCNFYFFAKNRHFLF